jgi:hypothetical protein
MVKRQPWQRTVEETLQQQKALQASHPKKTDEEIASAIQEGKEKYARLNEEEKIRLSTLYAKSSADRKKLRLTPEQKRDYDERLRQYKAKQLDRERRQKIRMRKSSRELRTIGLETSAAIQKARDEKTAKIMSKVRKAQIVANDMRRRSKTVTFSQTGMIREISDKTEYPESSVREWIKKGLLHLPLKPE